MNFNRTNLFNATGILAAAILIAGCASDPGRERSSKAVVSLTDLKKSLESASKDVDGANAAIAKIQTGKGQMGAFADYKSAVARILKEADSVTSTVQSMRGNGAEYRTTWKKEAEQISDPELRSAAEARATKVTERFNDIEAKLGDVRDTYQPYKTQLVEVQTYFSNDLTPAAVEAAKPTLQKTVDQGTALKEKMAAVVTELDSVTAALAPAK